jgi:hypothetical protein
MQMQMGVQPAHHLLQHPGTEHCPNSALVRINYTIAAFCGGLHCPVLAGVHAVGSRT